MASEIRVNSLTNRSGLSTVTIADTGVVVAGIVTASTFSGTLTGDVTGNTSGTAGGLTGSPSITVTDITASGNVSIAGTLTYEDVTNIDAVGIVTARAGVKVPDNQKIFLGTDDDLQIYHDGSSNVLFGNGTADLVIKDANHISAIFDTSAEIQLYYDNAKKLETSATGATVTGTLVSDSVTSELDLTAISSSISDTAVDVFIYDTSKDSDGGAWRKRTTHTSWYNETLGTSTRGSRKEFPAVAVIVAETTKVTIYDGDDPDLPMWMVFNQSTSSLGAMVGYTSFTIGCVHMLNGILMVGLDATNQSNVAGLRLINFISEHFSWKADGSSRNSSQHWPIEDRNGGRSLGYNDENYIVSEVVNDVVATVLPNAPIDDATGLPIPTIAVGTDGGVSVIRDDGTVVDSNDTNAHTFVAFDRGNNIWGGETFSNDELEEFGYVGSLSDGFGYTRRYTYGNEGGNPISLTPNSTYRDFTALSPREDKISIGHATHLTFLNNNKDNAEAGKVAYITSDYNTGWMHGDIKGAFLSDTDTTNVTVGSAHYTETFTGSGDNTWGLAGSATISGGVLTLANAGDSRATDLTAASSLTTGQKYIAEIEIVTNTSQVFKLDDDGSGAGQGSVTIYGSSTSGQTGTFLISFTKTGSPRMRFIRLSGGPATITSFKIYTAEEADRSVNNNGLKVFGTITKSAVATGAELVGYSGWSSSNYLRQPYNSDLDFGTGNWCYMFWYNPNDAESGDVIFSRWSNNVDSNNYPRIQAYFNSGNLRVDTNDTASGGNYQGHFGSDGTQDSNEWNCAAIIRRESNLEIWINGVNYRNAALNSSSSGSYTDTNAILEIGHSPGAGSAEAGLELALFRVSATAPSPDQVKKMYEDEKCLFHENAKATLYGSSDAVTALAFDDTTNLLHVGTSAGRSEFQGLRRINNTTDAVTTAISASNGLVAEQ